MSTTRGIVVGAIFAGLAIGTAGPTWAAPTMSGHYIKTETSPVGQHVDADWVFAPCGDGCAQITNLDGIGQARLVNGQWSMDGAVGDVACPDGTRVPEAASSHYSWDAVTLAGTNQVTYKAACGGTAETQTNTIQLRRVG